MHEKFSDCLIITITIKEVNILRSTPLKTLFGIITNNLRLYDLFMLQSDINFIVTE